MIAIVVLVIYSRKPQDFNGERAYATVKYQVEFGPRTVGSEAHTKTVSWITSSLKTLKWDVELQQTNVSNLTVTNIIARRGTGTPWIILGSHYDSRLLADQDPTAVGQTQPVLGADDGASSTAILIELARVLPANLDKQIWLVFFDAEDNGDILGYDWDLGSQYFVSQLIEKPDRAVILDMVGDKDLNIYMERNSNLAINQEIWGVAARLGNKQFIPTEKYSMIDDHTPFLRAGIPAVDIIDFDYPYWHTTQDTLDKISADSLKAVGETVLTWLEEYPR